MPTGYTADVQSGKTTEFRDFALQCARAFGALVLMRDDPNDAPIPEAFPPSTFAAERLVKARAELDRLQSMTPAEAERAATDAHHTALTQWRERAERRRVERERYGAMLAKVRAWEPPTVDHLELKKFMLDQLVQSIDFDCSAEYDEQPTKQSGAEWHAATVKAAEQDIAYSAKSDAEERTRTDGRNRWIQQLRDSFSTLAAK